MAKEKEVVREYNFADAILKQKCDSVANSVSRDIAEFNGRGVTSTTVSDFKHQAEAFDNLPTDEELQGAESDAVDDRDEKRDLLIVALTEFRTAAQNKWGENAGKYSMFGFDGMSELSDDKLHRCAKRVARVATAQLSDLASKGITTEKITALNDLNTAFDDSIDEIVSKAKERDIGTQTRRISGNALYKVLSELCNTGKNIWFSKDEAKYNDYVIYNTPGATPPAPPTPPVTPP